MGEKIAWLLLLAVVYQNHYSHAEEVDCRKEPKCKVYPTRGMMAADCYDKDFYNFPKCVLPGVEVIELTRNRIRTVTKSDLDRYSNLMYLYLTDNLISTLDDETFSGIDSLRSLHLSMNALVSVPSSIFKLPSLKTLVLYQNPSLNIAKAVQQAKPISSPLVLLDISLTTAKESPADFPDFGPLPFLTTLNVTGNHYGFIKPKHFAGLCNLHRFINNDSNVDYEDYCDCWIINKWLIDREVQLTPLQCPIPENKCSDKFLNEEDKKLYDQCKEMFDQIQTAHKMTKVGIGIGIAVLVVIVTACVCFLWIRKNRTGKSVKQREENDTTSQPSLIKKAVTTHTDDLTLLDKRSKISLPN